MVAAGVPHQVTQRGNRRQATFFCETDYDAYLDLMAEWRYPGTPYWVCTDIQAAWGVGGGTAWRSGESPSRDCLWGRATGNSRGSCIDGVLRDEISGTVDGTQKSYSITGSGTHTLMWEYEKESGDSNGSDCGWLDYLTWTGDTSPVEYTYDPSGRRAEKQLDGQAEFKYGAARPETAERDGDHCPILVVLEWQGG